MRTGTESVVLFKGGCANHMKKNAAVHTDNTSPAELPHESTRVLNMLTAISGAPYLSAESTISAAELQFPPLLENIVKYACLGKQK